MQSFEGEFDTLQFYGNGQSQVGVTNSSSDTDKPKLKPFTDIYLECIEGVITQLNADEKL
jgi:hypothetical protein